MIDILIPSYNRSEYLVKNILHIDKLISDEGLDGEYRILISDNASTDDTKLALDTVKSQVDVELVIFSQDKNLGLEKNAVFILGQATSEYVLFLGDDDFFPKGYLTKLSEVATKGQYGVVIPGCVALMPDGEVKVARNDLNSRCHDAGFKALADFVNFGHQLSGLFFKREGVVVAYKMKPMNYNIYPFIFFIGYVMQKYPSAYMPEYQMSITEGNSKDWGYDDSGLLTEIFKNYNALYPENAIKRNFLCLIMMYRQRWRLRIGRNPQLAIKSFTNLTKSKDIDVLLKIILPFLYILLYSREVVGVVKRKLL